MPSGEGVRRLIRRSRALDWGTHIGVFILCGLLYAAGLERLPAGYWFAFLALVVAQLFLYPWAYLLNDFCDVEDDRAKARSGGAEPRRPSLGSIVLLLVAGVAWTLAAFRGRAIPVAMVSVFVVALFSYSVPPLRLKGRGFAGVAAAALGQRLPFFLILCSWGGGSPSAPCLLIAAYLGCTGGLFILHHQIEDLEVDRATGIGTWGAREGRLFIEGALLSVRSALVLCVAVAVLCALGPFSRAASLRFALGYAVLAAATLLLFHLRYGMRYGAHRAPGGNAVSGRPDIRLAGLLFLAAGALLAFGPSIASPFFLDDYVHLERARHIDLSRLGESSVLRAGDLSAFWWVPGDIVAPYLRPLVTLSMAMDERLWGAIAPGYHITNVAFHALASLLVWRIGTRLLRARRAAAVAALLFFLHPIHAGAVQWISGRSDVIMAVFYLLSVSTYLDLRSGRRGERWKAIPVILGFVAALLSKESAITLPVLILAMEALVLRRPDGERETRGMATGSAHLTLLALVLIGGIYLCLRLPDLRTMRLPVPYRYPVQVSAIPDLLLQLLLYALSCVFILPVLPFHNLEAWKSHPLLLVFLTALLALLLRVAWRKAARRRLFAFLLVWWLVTLLPAAFLMMGQRFAYLPAAGFCLLVAMALPAGDAPAEGRGRAWASRIAVPLILGIYAITSMAEGTVVRALSGEADRMTRAIIGMARSEQGPRRVFLANGWVPNAFWIEQAARSIAPGAAPPITVLSLSPDLFPPAFCARHPIAGPLIGWLLPAPRGADPPRIDPVEGGALVRVAEGASFESPFLRFFLFGREGFSSGGTFDAGRATIEIVDAEGMSLREIRVTCPESPSAPRGLWLVQDDLAVRER